MKKPLTHSPFLDVFRGDHGERGGADPQMIIASVQRNLNEILNCRNRIYDIPRSHAHAHESMLDFGILDFSTVNIASEAGQQRLADAIQSAIQRFEPRLQNIAVSVLPIKAGEELSLRFRIDAMLEFKPYQERIRWDSVIEPVSRQISLSEAVHE